MPLSLDHSIIAVDDLEQAIHDYRSLGFNVVAAGVHANQATHSALILFSDGTYIELIAPTGDGFDSRTLTQRGEGLAGYALLCTDIEAKATRLAVKNET